MPRVVRRRSSLIVLCYIPGTRWRTGDGGRRVDRTKLDGGSDRTAGFLTRIIYYNYGPTSSSSFRFESQQLRLFQYAPFWNGSLVRQATPGGRATVPRLPHATALGVAGERTWVNARLGEQGAARDERSCPRSPIWRGIVKTRKQKCKYQYDAAI